MATYGTLQHRRPQVEAQPRRGGDRASWWISAAPHVMIKVKRLLPRVSTDRSGAVSIVDTPETARDVAWICDRWPLDMDPRTRAQLDARVSEHRARQEAIDDVLAGGSGALTLGMEPSRPPREYQSVAARMMRTSGRLILGDELGLGKSASALYLLDQPDALPALIVTLTHLPEQWLRELHLTWPMLIGHAAKKGTAYPLDQIRGHRGHPPDVIVMGYSKLAGWADALAGQVNTVIFDEVQELRGGIATAKGTAAAQIADQARFVVGLSATPVYNYGGEIHSIYSILAPDALGTRAEFLKEWTGGDSDSAKPIVKDPAALGTFLRDEGLFLRRTRKDVGRELPDPVRIRQEVDSDPAALDALSTDSLAMARLILDQDASHQKQFTARGDLDWKMRQATGIGKAPYVAEFVRMLLESEEKVLLFGWHRQVYSIWEERLRDLGVVNYTGSESPLQKRDAAAQFIDGDARVMMMSLRAGAGLDGLQKRCSVAVFGELDWSPGVHDQAVGRLTRDGQDAAVLAYFMVSNTGSDPVVDEVLQLKRMQGEAIRDPDAPLFQPSAPSVDRVRLLAQSIVDRAAR
jgi:SNF2 family DNA or RNA helicase